MTNTARCPECGRSELYVSNEVPAGAAYSPNYLPGLGNLFSAAKFTVVVCRDCGLTRFFASSAARSQLSESDKWSKL